MTGEELNRLTEAIISAAIDVHKCLGPGLLESAYEECLSFELKHRGFAVDRQKQLPVIYRSIRLDCGYKLDLLVENEVIVEIKALNRLAPVHAAQLLTYLKLSQRRVGLLINFNVKLLRDGINRLVKDFPE